MADAVFVLLTGGLGSGAAILGPLVRIGLDRHRSRHVVNIPLLDRIERTPISPSETRFGRIGGRTRYVPIPRSPLEATQKSLFPILSSPTRDFRIEEDV
jgi:hypothetical protein